MDVGGFRVWKEVFQFSSDYFFVHMPRDVAVGPLRAN